MTTCYIIDDDPHAITALSKYMIKLPYLKLVGSHTNSLMALEEIKKGLTPDLIN